MSERGVSKKKRRRERYAVRDDAGPSGETRTRGLLASRLLAVNEKCIGQWMALAFFDRCGNSVFASSAPGSAKPLFPNQAAPALEEAASTASTHR